MVPMQPSAATAEQRAELSLGIFMPNCSYSCSISTYKPDPDDWTFESNTAIAQAAEGAGTVLVTGSFHTVGDVLAELGMMDGD